MATNSQTVRNIAARFFVTADSQGDAPAVGISGDDAYLSYRQLADRVKECSLFLGRLMPGETVGLLSENRPEWSKAYLAVLSSGGTVVPVDSLLKAEELKKVFVESKIEKIFVSHRFIDVVEKIVSEIDVPIAIIDLENIPRQDISQFQPYYVTNPDDAAVLIFTSGTTGSSKQVILTHNNILSSIESIIECILFQHGDRFLSVLPLHHTFEGTVGFLLPLLNGCAVYYVKEINSREILTGIQKHKITHFLSVPLIYEKIYHGILGAIKKAPPMRRALFSVLNKSTRAIYALTGKNAGKKFFASMREKAGLSSIELFVSGGAALSVEVCRGFNLLGLTLIEGYGLTETAPVLTVNRPWNIQFGSVGQAMPQVQLKIDNPDANGVGEILAKGPMVTPGYKDNPEATKALFRDGWLCTGDMGLIDKKGFLSIKGRVKNLIVSAAGKNIYPEEIEAQLLGSEYILEAMVYGHQADNGREEVAALIYPDYDILSTELEKTVETITDDDLRAKVGGEIAQICSHMADYKRVKHIQYTREELIKTSTKKVKRYLY